MGVPLALYAGHGANILGFTAKYAHHPHAPRPRTPAGRAGELPHWLITHAVQLLYPLVIWATLEEPPDHNGMPMRYHR